MRSRSSKNVNKGVEVEKLNNKLKQEPHLSGAYIRSLVKQLTTSRTKDPMNPKSLDDLDGGEELSPPQSLTKHGGDGLSETQQTQHPPQQPKKQVRRRLHTSRPYQERLLNMAEARREIVTALKFHRASMKQANEQQQQQQKPSQYPQLPPPFLPSLEQEDSLNSRRNPMIYPSNSYLDNLSYSPFCSPLPNPFPWASSISPLPINENLNLSLPNQPLGLNLNFQDFNNIDTSLYHHSVNNNNDPSICLYPSPSSSSSTRSTGENNSVMMPLEEPHMMANATDFGVPNGGLHPAMDDEEMAKIRSIGEQHQMEWNDRVNLVRSAWWFKFLKTMEISPDEKTEEDEGFQVFDEVMEFPAWMNANENLQQHLDDYYSTNDYLQEPALPCMDIGEIEGMDAEWLA